VILEEVQGGVALDENERVVGEVKKVKSSAWGVGKSSVTRVERY
jgi:hypothetical protein